MDQPQVRLGVISEVHVVPPGTPPGHWHNPFLFDQAGELFAAAVERCQDLGVDAIAILGDLTHFADPGSFAVVRRVLEGVDRPVYVLPGNHDLDTSERPLAAVQSALDLPAVTFAPDDLMLTPDIALSLTSLEPAEPKRYAAVRSRRSSADARLTVVLTHFPAFAMKEMLSAADLKHAGDLANRDAFLERIQGIAGPLLILNGHLHVHATIADGRLLQLSVAALIEPPHDVTLVELGFDAAGHPWVGRRATGLVETPDVTLPVLSPRQECWRFDGDRWVSQPDV